MGACAYITDNSLMDVAFWKFFEKSHITYFAAGVPYAYDMLKQIGFLEKEHESLRFMTQGGGKLPEEQQALFGERLQKQGVRLYVCYGQTEATACISALSYEKASKKLGSVGAPVPGMSVSCIDANEKGEGELVCEGQSISWDTPLPNRIWPGETIIWAACIQAISCLWTGMEIFLSGGENPGL